MNLEDEIARSGLLMFIVGVIASTAGAIVSIERYTVLGLIRVYTSGMFAVVMVWSYGLREHWSQEMTIFYVGSACLFADYILIGLLTLVKKFSTDPFYFLDKWRNK